MLARSLMVGWIAVAAVLGCREPVDPDVCDVMDVPDVVFVLQDASAQGIPWQAGFVDEGTGEPLECHPWDSGLVAWSWGCALPAERVDVRVGALGYESVPVPVVMDTTATPCERIERPIVVALRERSGCATDMPYAVEISVRDPGDRARDDARISVERIEDGGYLPGVCELIASGRYGCMRGYGGAIDLTVEVPGFQARRERFDVEVDPCGPLSQSRTVRVQ